MRTARMLLLLAALSVPLSAMAQESASEDPSARANALFDTFFDEQLELSPMSQAYLGRRVDYDRWDEVSEAQDRRVVALYRNQLDRLRQEVDYEELDEQTQISYDLFVRQNEEGIERFRYRHHYYLLDQMYGWQSRIPSFLINIHRVDSKEDAEAYIARLHGIAPLIDQVIARVDEKAELGLLPPKFVYDHTLSDSRNVISGAPFDDGEEENVLMADVRTKVTALDLPDEEEARLIEAAREALLTSVAPAYGRLIDRAATWQAAASTDDGVWCMEEGEAFYGFQLKSITTTNLTADEIHRIGLEEVARIHDEMRAIKESVGFDGTLQDFFAFMRTDPRFYYENTPEGKETYLKEATAIIDSMRTRLDDLFVRMPEADIVVKAVEPFREASAGKAFYQRPAPDGSRPGTYYANLYDMADMPTYQMEALAYHEGIPGHHMQIAVAQELEGLPLFRKYGGFTAYTEGWGLYAEYVPREIGFYKDPYSDFGRLAMELWRACRLVVDTGIHHKKWTRQEAIDYLAENTPNPDGDIEKAIERYIVMPGQATAYKLGMLKIMELRRRAEARLGEAFDIRQFHDTVVRYGPVPLSTLEMLVESWIAEQG